MNDRIYLYVEDDPLSREALEIIFKRVLKIEHVYIFEDSTDMMARIRALPCQPDIILLDIHMEPYTGFEVLEMLRADSDYQDSIIVAITASVMSEEVDLLKSSGFDGAIGKPINVASFPALMERVIAGETLWHVIDN